MTVSENSKKVFDYVKANEDKDITAKDIAEALGLSARGVNGAITSAFQRKGLMERVEAEVENEDGDVVKVKYIKLTPEGRNLDYDDVETNE